MRGWLYKRVSHPYAPPGLQWRKRYFYVERGELRYDSIKAQRATSGESAGPAFPLRLLRSCDRFGDKFCVTCDETDDAGTPLTMLLRAESKETAAFWCSALLWLAHLRIDAPMRGVGPGQRRRRRPRRRRASR